MDNPSFASYAAFADEVAFIGDLIFNGSQNTVNQLAETKLKLEASQTEARQLQEECSRLKLAVSTKDAEVEKLKRQLDTVVRDNSSLKLEGSLKLTFLKLIDTFSASGNLPPDVCVKIVTSSMSKVLGNTSMGRTASNQAISIVTQAPLRNENSRAIREAGDANVIHHRPANVATTSYPHPPSTQSRSDTTLATTSNNGPPHRGGLSCGTQPPGPPVCPPSRTTSLMPQTRSGQPNSRTFSCHLCPQLFSYIYHLQVHLQQVHGAFFSSSESYNL